MLLQAPGRPDLVVGPSGYGLPSSDRREATEDDLRLAFLAPPDETGGIGGLRRLARHAGASGSARGLHCPASSTSTPCPSTAS